MNTNDFDFEFEMDNLDPKKQSNKEAFTKEIRIKISATTFLQWKEAKKRMEQICGYDNESKVFEFMLIEFLNIPLKSFE